MKPMKIIGVFIFAIVTIWVAVPCSAGRHRSDVPIKLQVVSPEQKSKGRESPVQFRGGWPLTFRLVIREKDMLGIGIPWLHAEVGTYDFPSTCTGGMVIFDDPDGCFSPQCVEVPDLCGCEEDHLFDETILEFHPDPGDLPRVDDRSQDGCMQGNSLVRSLLSEDGAVGGPELVDPAFDGIGYGADEDLPGLVILADTGVGVVGDAVVGDGWIWPVPTQARNLAGFLSSVAYELNDARGRTTITATMIVPEALFSRRRLVDHCVDDGCTGEPLQEFEDGFGDPEPLDTSNPNYESVAEIRAFVVHSMRDHPDHPSAYPDRIIDENGDGVVDADDAVLMGYELLSNEVVITVRQIGNIVGFQKHCMPGPNDGTDIWFDLDENGSGYPNNVDCPHAVGGLGKVPR